MLQSTFSKTLPTSPNPSTYTGLPVDQDDWTCAQWKVYYENNKKVLGKAKALSLMEVDTSNVGFFGKVPYCRYDCDFVNYFNNEGLNTGNIFSKTYCTATNVVDAAGNVAQTVSQATHSKFLVYGAAAFGLFLAYKTFAPHGK